MSTDLKLVYYYDKLMPLNSVIQCLRAASQRVCQWGWKSFIKPWLAVVVLLLGQRCIIVVLHQLYLSANIWPWAKTRLTTPGLTCSLTLQGLFDVLFSVKLLFHRDTYKYSSAFHRSLFSLSGLINWTFSSPCSLFSQSFWLLFFNFVQNVLAIGCSPTQIRFCVFWSAIGGSADLAAHWCRTF